MCHLPLFMPLLALPLFWLVPDSVAVPIYVAILGLSAGVYFIAMKAMHRPSQIGIEALAGKMASVAAIHAGTPYVRLGNETWAAQCPDGPIAVGDRIRVTDVDGLTLIVEKIDAGPHMSGRAPGVNAWGEIGTRAGLHEREGARRTSRAVHAPRVPWPLHGAPLTPLNT